MSRLWYNEPAKKWEEALPIGNGKIGAMVFGEVKKEHIQLNEDTVWYGGPRDRNNPDALKYLPEIRKNIIGGKITEAESLMKYALSGVPQGQRTYQSLGDVFIEMNSGIEYSEYEHSLDLETAIDRVDYVSDDIHFLRETFISAPQNVLVMRLSSDSDSKISFTSILKREKFYDTVTKSDENGIVMSGNLGKGGLDFKVLIKCAARGGTVKVIGEHLIVDKADEAVLYLSAITTFERSNGNIRNIEAIDSEIRACIEVAMDMEYEELKELHIEDYRKLYGRVDLKIEGTNEFEKFPTDKRLKMAAESGHIDSGLSELYFDFGRYLLISCSREGSLPANLQGIWNGSMNPSWDSKYTININTEMNYWPAEVCNLSECHRPLFELIKRMVPNGRITARKMYGCKGFVAHHNTDIWADTAVQDLWIPGSYWVMGAAWLCTHLWTHYEYTKDKAFLEETFYIMREAAEFFLDFLIEDDGYLKTCPSVSPENTFILPNGQKGANTIGVTMDNQILRDLFGQCISAARILGIEDTLNDNIINALGRLQPAAIGKYGQIIEWDKDYDELDPGHRHISQLYGLHPSAQITPDKTPELAEAARATLERRLSNGGGHTGWSRAWIINNYAKLWDSENAFNNLEAIIIKSTLPNMLDNHPPFQIDGNFGATAGIAEMLVQSTMERIVVLPALPKEWENGHVCGLRVRGGASIDICWKNGMLKNCTIRAVEDIDSRIVYKGIYKELHLKKNETAEIIY